MKKATFLLFMLIISVKAYNQVSQGPIVIGGEFMFQVNKTKSEQGNNTSEGPTFSKFSLVPNFEYFLSENFSAGIGIGYIISRTKSESSVAEIVQKDGVFIIAPYVKKYFPIGDRAFFYGQGIVQFGIGKETSEVKMGNTTTSSSEDNNSVGIGIVPGFRYNISDKIGLEAGIGYLGFMKNVQKSGSGNNEKRNISNTFEFSIIPNSITFGLRYTL